MIVMYKKCNITAMLTKIKIIFTLKMHSFDKTVQLYMAHLLKLNFLTTLCFY